MSECVYVCPLGSVDEGILDCVAASLATSSKMAVKVLPAMGDPSYAYDGERGQYSSKRVLKRLSACCPRETFKIIGVTRVDLYVPILTFVFGAAQMSGQCAVISTRRLDPIYYQEPRDHNLLMDRVQKTAVHELGHSMGLIHCRDRRCVMFSSTRIEDTDFKKSEFCHTCRELFRWNLAHPLEPAETKLQYISTDAENSTINVLMQIKQCVSVNKVLDIWKVVENITKILLISCVSSLSSF